MTVFTGIASDYDNLWLLTDDYRDWMLKKLLRHLKMEPDSRFADLGGGTGLYTHLLRQTVPLENAPSCVEPCKAMLRNAQQYRGLQRYPETAEAFVKRGKKLDRILVKEAIHHIHDRKAFWKDIRSSLRPSGRALVVTRPKLPDFPLFRRALTAFSESQPSLGVLVSEISDSGLNVDVETYDYQVEITKERWFALLRARFMSSLFDFTDSEIEHGIQEIDAHLEGDQVRFIDQLVFLEVEQQAN